MEMNNDHFALILFDFALILVAFPHMLSLWFLLFSLLEKICSKLHQQQCNKQSIFY